MANASIRSNNPLTAADVMTPAPRTCSPFSSVLEAVMIFRDADCGAVPVLKDGKAIGVLTDRDVALALGGHPDLASRPVEEIMTKEVITIDSDASIDTVREMFGERTVRRLLVVGPHGELAGIIAWSDIAPYSSEREVGEVVTETVEQP